MKCYEFHLRISPASYLEYYRGTVRHVVARCTTGQTVQFPASLLQKFVTAEGVNGRFILSSDDNNKGPRPAKDRLRLAKIVQLPLYSLIQSDPAA